jgi:cytochrome c oxidase assembly protein subunit 15
MAAVVIAGESVGAQGARRASTPRAVAVWLFACCALVFAMVVVGGVTRLTHSGLSITEWQPVVGAVPPLSAGDWNDAFSKYQATPEFREVNHDMTLAQFKRIFWWEYFHRLLGRAIGAAFLLPYLWFLLRDRIPRGYAWPLAGIFLLLGLQGLVGWLMVKSGLVADPRVSQFRLAAHLGLAFAIFAALFWTALSLALPVRQAAQAVGVRRARRIAFVFTATVFLMVLLGALVAGIRAGFAYNTFPLMNGRVVPPEIMMLTPWWKNFFWNMATVQFDHRAIGWLLALLAPMLWWRTRAQFVPGRARRGADVLLVMVAVQLGLGIATLINVVPLPLAVLHQAGAVLVFALALNVAHALR